MDKAVHNKGVAVTELSELYLNGDNEFFHIIFLLFKMCKIFKCKLIS